MQSIQIAEHLPRISNAKQYRARRELVIIVAILLLGLVGISTCLIDDGASSEYTIQKMHVSALSMN